VRLIIWGHLRIGKSREKPPLDLEQRYEIRRVDKEVQYWLRRTSGEPTIAFVETQERFVEETEGVHDAIITVLDRHVWSEAGEKLIEVGSSFRREDFRRDFRINDRFHYVIIHKNEGGRQP
jgi:hypothetical protein